VSILARCRNTDCTLCTHTHSKCTTRLSSIQCTSSSTKKASLFIFTISVRCQLILLIFWQKLYLRKFQTNTHYSIAECSISNGILRVQSAVHPLALTSCILVLVEASKLKFRFVEKLRLIRDKVWQSLDPSIPQILYMPQNICKQFNEI